MFDREIIKAEKDFQEAFLGHIITRIVERLESKGIIEIKEKKMKFAEAVSNLKDGEFVSRDKWDMECGYLVYLPGLTHFLKVTTQPKPNVIPWAADIEDAISEDWKVIERNMCEEVTVELAVA